MAHPFLHIAREPYKGSTVGGDDWYWCPECGALSSNRLEFWKPPIKITKKGVLPYGSQDEPKCK